MVVPEHDGGFVGGFGGEGIDVRAAARTPDLAMSSAGTAEELVAETRSPEKRPAMRKTLRTGLSMPLVERVRKPSK